MNKPNGRTEFDEYLGFFVFLGVILFVCAVVEAALIYGDRKHLDSTPPVAYPILIALGCILTVYLPSIFTGKTYSFPWDRILPNPNVSAQSKRQSLLIVFTVYLVTLSLLASWGGGATQSPYGNLLILTASLTAYVAKQWYTKTFVGSLTVFAYMAATMVYFSKQQWKVEWLSEWPWGYFVIIVVVVFISVVSSTTIKAHNGDEPIQKKISPA